MIVPISPPFFGLRRAILIIAALFLSTPLWADPIAIPQWARPVEDQLPKLSPAIISEVDDLFKIMEDERHSGNDSGRPSDAEYLKASLRLVDLREQADQAMIWRYLKEQTGPNASPALALKKAALRREGLLMRLRDDPNLPQWLLPLIRERMKWLKSLLQSHQIDGADAVTEISGIASYLYRHGEISDIETLEQLIAMGESGGFFGDFFRGRKAVNELIPGMRQSRAKAQSGVMPYWRSVALSLVARKLVDKNSLDLDHHMITPSTIEPSLSPSHANTVAPQESSPSTVATPASKAVLGVLALAAIVLLLLIFGNRHEPV